MLNPDHPSHNSRAHNAQRILATQKYPQHTEDGNLHPEHQKLRLNSFNASESPAILGLFGPAAKQRVRAIKMGLIQDGIRKKDGTKPKPLQYGQDMEPIVIEMFEAQTGKNVRSVGSVPHPLYPWLRGSPDGFILEEQALVEVKTGYSVAHSLFFIKPEHFVQIQTQLACCDLEFCYLLRFFENALYVDIVKRETKWFDAAYPAFQREWDELQAAKQKAGITDVNVLALQMCNHKIWACPECSSTDMKCKACDK